MIPCKYCITRAVCSHKSTIDCALLYDWLRSKRPTMNIKWEIRQVFKDAYRLYFRHNPTGTKTTLFLKNESAKCLSNEDDLIIVCLDADQPTTHL